MVKKFMNYIKLYTNFLEKFLKPLRQAQGRPPLKVVFDCSNGTTGKILGELFRDPSLRSGQPSVFLINKKPDGRFPAHGPNPMLEGAMNDLSKAVLKNKADLGVIFDADGDRVFFVDDRGKEVINDVPIILLAKNFSGPIVLTINVGILARDLLEKSGKKILDSRVGHYFIKQVVRKKKINFAAERSGHYYFKKFFYADSGIFAAIQFINSVSGLKEKLSDWIDELPQYYRSGEINFEIHDKESAMKRVEKYYSESAPKVSRLDGLTMESKEWWFNLRPSNTENLIRLNFEARDRKVFEKELENFKKLLS